MTVNTESRVETKGSFWSATFLISGTCIGGGMLGMPVQTAEAGFLLSFLTITACWIFMTFTGLLLVEATTWVRNETHFASLSRILVGNKIKGLALFVYLFMNYASLIAYTAGGAALVNLWTKAAFGIHLNYATGCIIFTVLFGLIVYFGAHLASRLNFILMIALVVSYLGLIGFGIGNIHIEYLNIHPDWRHTFGIVSMILATFSYQMVVPSVCSYLKYDKAALKRAIIIGTSLPFAVYTLWLLVVHGCVPLEGANGLREAFKNGSSATISLRAVFNHPALSLLSDLFAFFAITTSYISLSLALFDFLRDTLREFKMHVSRNFIVLTTLIPTLILAILFPRALLRSLDLSGGFGDTILSGLIPISMVWIGRYKKNLPYEIPGGKAALVLTAAFYLFFLIVQFVQIWPR